MRGEEELIAQLVLRSEVLIRSPPRPKAQTCASKRFRSQDRRPCKSCSNWTEHVQESLDEEAG